MADCHDPLSVVVGPAAYATLVEAARSLALSRYEPSSDAAISAYLEAAYDNLVHTPPASLPSAQNGCIWWSSSDNFPPDGHKVRFLGLLVQAIKGACGHPTLEEIVSQDNLNDLVKSAKSAARKKNLVADALSARAYLQEGYDRFLHKAPSATPADRDEAAVGDAAAAPLPPTIGATASQFWWDRRSPFPPAPYERRFYKCLQLVLREHRRLEHFEHRRDETFAAEGDRGAASSGSGTGIVSAIRDLYRRLVRPEDARLSKVATAMTTQPRPGPAETRSPEDRLAEKERAVGFARRLPPFERLVFWHFCAGFTSQQIADGLGCSKEKVDQVHVMVRSRYSAMRYSEMRPSERSPAGLTPRMELLVELLHAGKTLGEICKSKAVLDTPLTSSRQEPAHQDSKEDFSANSGGAEASNVRSLPRHMRRNFIFGEIRAIVRLVGGLE